jgi:hypothetical protein
MKRFDALHDTIPCPPPSPESSEHAVARIHVGLSEQELAPRLVESVLTELRVLIAGLECPDHHAAPVVHVELGSEDRATAAVMPANCCAVLDEHLAQVLRGSPIFRLMSPV